MTDRYERIRRALAMGPTPGPWVQDGDGVTADDEDVAVAMCCPSDAEAAYIAACDPDTSRALLAERDALTAEVERLAEALRELEEREQRDEALLRQALEALEQIATDLPWDLTGLQADTIAALRERLRREAAKESKR
jgi:hypothetical protein